MIGKDKDKKPADASDITTDSADPTNPTASAPGSALSTRTSTPTPGASSKDIAPDGKTPDDSSKLRTFLSILKRFIGVTDIAAVRFSLPAQLLEPIPNLEYWHYLDRPETFVAIGDSEEPLGRMLGCLRFWFTKDLKYVHGKPCKPYNSTLGEFFRCQWDVEDTAPSLGGSGTTANVQSTTPAPASGETTKNQPIRVSYLTEQTSHHPPVSAYYVDCPDKGIKAVGYDQLSAKFTGTSIRVTAGQYNEGIWVSLQKRGEDYQLTHPAAYLGGFLRGNLSVTVADTCFVTCAQTGIKVILHYLEEGYFGKTQNKVEGVIYSCNVEKDKTTRIKDVPDKDVLGRIDGCWTDSIYFSPGATDFKKTADKDRILLVNVSPLRPVPKTCPPLEQQLPNESQRFWHDVTHSITSKQFAAATTQKTEIEEKQRERAAERKAAGTDWTPRFFTGATVPKGRPELSSDGVLALQRLHDGNWALDPPTEYGAL
nr:oxysterol-binding protein-like protein 1 [Quercus suber]